MVKHLEPTGQTMLQSEDSKTRLTLPRIVLRDVACRPLDTFTSYQRAIAESRSRLAAVMQEPNRLRDVVLGPSEWRLPHAPVPSRPDYTRTGAQTRYFKRRTFADILINNGGEDQHSRLVDALDVGLSSKNRFILTNSGQIIDVTSRDWILLCRTADKVLGPMGTSLLPPRDARPPFMCVHRCRAYNRPGDGVEDSSEVAGRGDGTNAIRQNWNEFRRVCPGCRRREGWTFCYGCERCSEPHYHRDKMARAGGGFTYFKRDRPIHTIAKNHPLNWSLNLDIEAHYDGGLYQGLGMNQMNMRRWGTDIADLDQKDVGSIFDFAKGLYAPLLTAAGDMNHETNNLRGSKEQVEKEDAEHDEFIHWEQDGISGVKILINHRRRENCHTIPTATDHHGYSSEDTSGIESAAARGVQHAREKLYKAPRVFQLKKQEHKAIVAKSPFSTDRNLNLSKYRLNEIHKSDKVLTEFIGIERRGVIPMEQETNYSKLKDQIIESVDAVISDAEPFPDTAPMLEPRTTPEPQLQPEEYQDECEPITATDNAMITQKSSQESSATTPNRQEQTAEETAEITVESPETIESAQTALPPTTEGIPPEDNEENSPSAYHSGDSGDTSPVGDHVSESGSTVREDVQQENEEETTFEVTDDVSEPVPRSTELEVPVASSRPTTSRSLREKHQNLLQNLKQKETKEEMPSNSQPTEPEPEEIPDTPPPDFVPQTFKDIELPMRSIPRVIEWPPLPTAAPPSLPKTMSFIESVKPLPAINIPIMEVPPPLMEPPKQRRPPPSLKGLPKLKNLPRMLSDRVRSPGAQVSAMEIKSIADPLDFLAKFCIIHPDRLPHYVRVFSKTVAEQMYRYVDVPHHNPLAADKTDSQRDEVQPEIETNSPPKVALTDAEKRRIHDFTILNASLRAENPKIGINEGDQMIDKINYTMDNLLAKFEDMQSKLQEITETRTHLLAALGRKHFPEILKPSYKLGKPKRRGKPERKENEGNSTVVTNENEKILRNPRTLTDEEIVNRLNEKQLNSLTYDVALNRANLEYERMREKRDDLDSRIQELEDEKLLVQLFARDEFQRLETIESKDEKFIRQQSALYQKLHPIVNVEMNVSDLEEALREVNGHLITEKEIQYVFHILNIPGRKRIDVQLFSVIAALSEKVAQVDPFIKKLINKFDFEALNVKMDKAKELFSLLTEDEVDVPLGQIASQMLAIELAAGGVTQQHTEYVLSKFDRDRKGIIDFMDYLTYVPLFIEIHGRILNSPLKLDRNW